ncbi:hypothetical protein [Amycolatopsis sp. NPDC051372]|uniref:hypothetical protein n=1 Tax=Amycolatopsis sp. NPDC051372 TaxID=3155669 RepID=UPI003429FCF4
MAGSSLAELGRRPILLAFAQESGLIRTTPGGTHLVVEDLQPIDFGTSGTLRDEVLTPGYLWKFQRREWGYCEMTLTVNAGREAELTLTKAAAVRALFAENSSRHPATREGWREMLHELKTRVPKTRHIGE